MTLTTTLTDANGISNDVIYQWYADGIAIKDASAKSYTLKHADAMKVITVRAAFVDDDGYAEAATSADSVPVMLPNDIGVQGKSIFGGGITDILPAGMSEMEGTTTPKHKNYGNYRYNDGSIMCWIPQFYYRWGHADSPRATKYGLNALDVKSKHDFADVAAANAAGYALHRAFCDGGKIKDGFFVDKFLVSNKDGVASSVGFGIPLSSSDMNAPFSSLKGAPASNLAGSIDAIKTRGNDFFVTTLFIQNALSLLSLAQAQAATNIKDCAWYDATGIANFPKGCNDVARGDVNDKSVLYKSTDFDAAVRTGSGYVMSKVTHNGQYNGVADLNGVMSEISLGLTTLSGVFFLLKTTAKASDLTSGNTTVSDAWGSSGVSANYELLAGTGLGALSNSSFNLRVGNENKQVFSGAMTGSEWQASCAGIPLTDGVSASGLSLFGNDYFLSRREFEVVALKGGGYGEGALAGVFCLQIKSSRTYSNLGIGARAAMYVD